MDLCMPGRAGPEAEIEILSESLTGVLSPHPPTARAAQRVSEETSSSLPRAVNSLHASPADLRAALVYRRSANHSLAAARCKRLRRAFTAPFPFCTEVTT